MVALASRVPTDVSPAAPQGAEIVLAGITKRYGERTVLNELSLQIAAGSFVAIVGRSGCGKSTLLRLLGGLERADDGTIEINANGRAARTRLMFQDARLLPWRRVLANAALSLPRDEIGTAQALLAEVGLADRAQDWPSDLSGGQRQRVALARALAQQPDLLLLDEPLGALDALTRIEMQSLIERLWRAHGCTAVLVTHDVTEAVTLADRIIVIEDGTVALDLPVPSPRPRRRGADFSETEQIVLNHLLRNSTESQRPALHKSPLRA